MVCFVIFYTIQILQNCCIMIPYIGIKLFRCFCGIARNFEILATQKCIIPLLSMMTRWPSSKIYLRKGPILENFVP